MEGAFTTCSD